MLLVLRVSEENSVGNLPWFGVRPNVNRILNLLKNSMHADYFIFWQYKWAESNWFRSKK